MLGSKDASLSSFPFSSGFAVHCLLRLFFPAHTPLPLPPALSPVLPVVAGVLESKEGGVWNRVLPTLFQDALPPSPQPSKAYMQGLADEDAASDEETRGSLAYPPISDFPHLAVCGATGQPQRWRNLHRGFVSLSSLFFAPLSHE